MVKTLKRNIISLISYRLHSVNIENEGVITNDQTMIYDNIGMVKDLKMIGNTLHIHSRNSDNTSSNIFVRNGDTVRNFKSAQLGDVKEFLFVDDDSKLLYISEVKLSKVTVNLINLPDASDNSKEYLDTDDERFNIITHEIVEISDVMFRFPNLVVIKGGYEVIHVNVVNDHYTFFRLPGSLMTIGRHAPNHLEFTGLIDFKDCFLKLHLNIVDCTEELVLEVDVHKYQIPKSKLPGTKLIGMFEDERVEISATKADESTILHFKSGIFTLSTENGTSAVFKGFKSGDNPDMQIVENLGMILYEKDKKEIKLIPVPLNFKKESKHVVLYKSNNFLKRVVIGATNKVKGEISHPTFYICDEAKYIKE
jgi:hypothetical protein